MRRFLILGLGVAAAAAIVFVFVPFQSPWGSRGPDKLEQARALRLAVISRLQESEELGELSARPTGPVRAARPSPVKFGPVRAVRKAGLAVVGPLTFGQPTISGIGGTGFEEDIRLDPTSPNRIYTSVPASLSSDTSWIWRSQDGGKTFKWVPAAAPLTGGVDPCAGGGDTELAVDPAGRLYFNDLTLANFSTARSDDKGVTFTCSNTGVPDTAVDRQWYAIDGDPLAGGSIYLTNDEIGPGAVQCGPSIGNNVLVMYRSPVTGAEPTAGIQFGPANKVTAPLTCDEAIMGNNEVSPVATKTGQIVAGQPTTLPTAVKHVYVIHDDATLSKILIGRCFPVAFGPPVTNVSDPSGLNCVDLPVANLGAPGTVKTGGDFPTMAIDSKGNLYAVWEQAPIVNGRVGNSALMYAYSKNEGNTWSAPVQIPTPGLLNNVFAWIGAGDDGRVAIAWVGTPAPVNPNASCPDGPDSVNGIWSMYVTQSLNAHAASPTFSPPTLAGEHYIHKGGIQTLLGGQCGDRTLGDFFQLRVGSQGEVHLSYADSNNIDAIFAPHAMYVRQISGPSLLVKKTVKGDPILLGSATDPAGDGIYEAGGLTSANMPNLDILRSNLSVPSPSKCHPAGTPCLRVTMALNNLSLAAPVPPDLDDDLVWLTQWLVPADPNCASPAPSCANGGRNLFVYAESHQGGAIRCYSGENAAQLIGGGVALTYPGAKEITAPGACKALMGAGGSATGASGTITIEVPRADVSLDPGVAPLDSKLYSVTASTMTLQEPADTVPSLGGIGGSFFNLIDVVRGYDVVAP